MFGRKKKGFGSKIVDLLTRKDKNEKFFEDLEDLLIEGDLGAVTAMDVVDELRSRKETKHLSSLEEYQDALKNILRDQVRTIDILPEPDKLNFYLVLGVNGVGKTTSIAKMAELFRREKQVEPVLSAGDTFRAAAIDQLKHHGDKLGMKVIHQEPGSDPGAVIFDTLDSVQAKGGNVIIADTAGRMHNKNNLVRELQKIDKIIKSKIGAGSYHKLLVVDATTGQNGTRQAEVFHDAVGLDGIILTKYDSSAKGGSVISISKTLKLPFAFVGTGEKYSDFAPFDRDRYLDELLGIK